MCSRFWKDFEDKVISNITNEHAELKRLREKSTYWKSRFKEQASKLLKSEHDDVSYCNLCQVMFINGEDTMICECGAYYCGDDSGDYICCTMECFRCNSQICMECSTYCKRCDERYCSECVPRDSTLVYEEDDDTHQYCSTKCKNKNKK